MSKPNMKKKRSQVVERDIHFWLESPETENMQALWTVSEGRRTIAKSLPLAQVLAFLFDDLRQDEETN